MASTVDICNAALSHIGDSANITSINPPDGSTQAAYCATFYPLALAAVLEMFDWSFSTTRVTLAPVTNPSTTWLYAYACPTDAIGMIAVLSTTAGDDYSQNYSSLLGIADFASGGPASPDYTGANPAANFYSPKPFAMEIDAQGNQLILTNLDSAVLRYTKEVSDPTQFSPTFTLALSFLLASLLAGPIVKGEAGTAVSNAMLAKFKAFEAIAEPSDASHARILVQQSVPWMAGR